MKGASKRGRGPWRCRLAAPIRSSQSEDGFRDIGLVLLSFGGAAPADACQRSADARPSIGAMALVLQGLRVRRRGEDDDRGVLES